MQILHYFQGMDLSFYIVAGFIVAAAVVTMIAKKLTSTGALAGAVIGIFIFTGSSYAGLIMLTVFFILGTAATTFKLKQKQALHIAETNTGRRNVWQVLANGGLAAVLGLLAWQWPQYSEMFIVMMAAVFASASADTLSSELGNVFGKNFYNILTFKRDQRGLDGVVSVEGTLCGLAGSIVIAGIYATGFGLNACFIYIVIAGTIGNIVDSILGATVERKGLIGNNTVNFINTLVAALAALGLVSMVPVAK